MNPFRLPTTGSYGSSVMGDSQFPLLLDSVQDFPLQTRALPTETKVESRTSHSQSGTSVNLGNSGKSLHFSVWGGGLTAGCPPPARLSPKPLGNARRRVLWIITDGFFTKVVAFSQRFSRENCLCGDVG